MSAPHPNDLSSLLNVIASSEVIELSTSSFTSVIEPKSTVLVVFYSSAYSQNSVFNSAIEEAARTLAYSGIRVGRVDCVREYTLGRAYGVKEYPWVDLSPEILTF